MMDGLYRTRRTYFDSNCHEFKEYPVAQKLIDIGIATWHGHDIRKDIRYILDNYSYVSEYNIRRALWTMIAEVNGIDVNKRIVFNNHNKWEADVEILLEDLMRRFRLTLSGKPYLAENHNIISFSELDKMNGWKAAIANREPYSMYREGQAIFFPGDDDLIRQFNLNNYMHGTVFPSYIYPEPWYGNPLRAKVIILGNEARFDEFTHRIGNLVLQPYCAMCEGVQCTVDEWMSLSGCGLYYATGNITDSMHLSPLDPYNSTTYRHWLTQIRLMADNLDIDHDSKLFSNIAVINANPYPSVHVAPLDAGLLPSHYFLIHLIRYILVHNPDTIFLIPSDQLYYVWKKILGHAHTDIFARGQGIVLSKQNQLMRLTLQELKPEQISTLRNLLTK